MKDIIKNNPIYSVNLATLTLRNSYIDSWHIVVTDPRSARNTDQEFEPLEKQ